MKGLPVELLYTLVIGAFLVVQYLVKRYGVFPKPADALPQKSLPEAQPEVQETPASDQWGRGPKVAAASFAASGWDAGREVPVASAATPRRRPAALSLLGGDQNLRRAIVGMTLLGPCRAREPLENR